MGFRVYYMRYFNDLHEQFDGRLLLKGFEIIIVFTNLTTTRPSKDPYLNELIPGFFFSVLLLSKATKRMVLNAISLLCLSLV